MTDRNRHFTSKHALGCLAVILVAVVAVLAGAGSGVLLFALICPLMMGAMIWMMMGGMGGGSRDDRK